METNQQMLTRMRLDMQMRGMSQHSLDVYIRCVRFFLEWRDKEGGELDESTARAYLIHLVRGGKVSTGTVNMYNAAIRFFYAVTLNRTMTSVCAPCGNTGQSIGLNIRLVGSFFRWRDYSDGNKQKVMTLTAEEFIRRFLMHVLPTGFRKIRHYVCSPHGIRANA